jgi:hypothetical protein
MLRLLKRQANDWELRFMNLLKDENKKLSDALMERDEARDQQISAVNLALKAETERDNFLEQLAQHQSSQVEKDMQEVMSINNRLKEKLDEACKERDAFSVLNIRMSNDDREVKTELEAEVKRLRALLRPFADYAVRLDGNYTTAGYPDACPLMLCPDKINQGAPTVGDLRRAATALLSPPERG